MSNKHFYKGAPLNLVFSTPVPQSGDRKTITGYAIAATIQDKTPLIEVIDQYSFRLFLSEAKSLTLTATDVPVVVWMRKDGNTLIGRNCDLIAVDPKFGLPVTALDDPGALSLIFGNGDTLSLEMDVANFPTSPYELWVADGHPTGTQAEFLAAIMSAKFETTAPAYRNSPGVKGQAAIGAAHLHCCVATNAWKSVALTDILGLAPTTTEEPTTAEPTTEEATTTAEPTTTS